MAGDTAQTVEPGVAFRFKDLRAELFRAMQDQGLRGAKPPAVRPARATSLCLLRACRAKILPPHLDAQVVPLLQNFRTHEAISGLAHCGVLAPLQDLFPHSIDRLPPERSTIPGS